MLVKFFVAVNLTDLVTSTSTCLLCLLRLLSQFCWFGCKWLLVELVKAILLVVLVEAEQSLVLFDAVQSVGSGVAVESVLLVEAVQLAV